MLLTRQIFLGGEALVTKAHAGLAGQSPSEIPAIGRRHRPKPLDFYAEKAANRRPTIFPADRRSGYATEEIGDYLRIHCSTGSRVVKHHAGEKT